MHPILLLISETAAKTSDVTDLKWKQVDFKNGKISLLGSEKIQDRNLSLSQDCISALKIIDPISEYVFTNLEGRPLRKEVLVRELRILKRQCGIKEEWVFRDLRHSFAVNFLKAGGDIKDLSKTLGHGHIRMTEELYGHFKTNHADFFDIEVVPGTEVLASENVGF